MRLLCDESGLGGGTAGYHLAMDESLLARLGEGEPPEAYLRFWEVSEPAVIMGYGGRLEEEVNVEACRLHGIPVYRRRSGGGTVLLGPGCLNYSLLFPREWAAALSTVQSTNTFCMETLREAISKVVGEGVSVQGDTDLVYGLRKCSGNAQRRTRDAVLFHGTLLYAMDLGLLPRVLKDPKRCPAYRDGRGHLQFLTNLPASKDELQLAVARAWDAIPPYSVEGVFGGMISTEVLKAYAPATLL